MNERKSTLKENFSMSLIGFVNQSIINQMIPFFSNTIKELSTLTDVSTLDGISFTIGDEEYFEKLKQFNNDLTPSNDEGVGVAMTISSINGDFSKNHIVINCTYFELENLLDEYESHTNNEIKDRVISKFTHMLFHEMCHVMNNKMIIDRYPILSLRERFPNELQMMKHAITHTCWDEFHVCSVANQVGEDQEENYKLVLISAMNNFEYKRDEIFKNYLSESSLNNPNAYSNLFNETMLLVYSLFKYSGYYLGDLITKENNKINDIFLHHDLFWILDELNSVLSFLHTGIKNNSINEQDFFKVGELAEKFAKKNGLIIEETENQGLFVNLDMQTQAKLLDGV